MSKNLTDRQIAQRKKVQSAVSQTTGGLGLAALGGTLLATKRGGKASNAAFRAAGKTRPKSLAPENLKEKTAPLLATSAGIGALGSFNFASYTKAEAKKKPGVVKKSMDMEPLAGEVGIAKNWQPQARNYNSEKNRDRRGAAYTAALGAGAGAAAGNATFEGVRAGSNLRSARTGPDAYLAGKKNPTKGQKAYAKGMRTKSLKAAKVAGKKAGVSAGVAAAVGGAAALSDHKRRKGSWTTYGKSAEITKAGDWKTIGQREQTQRRNRKTMRAAGAGAAIGGGLVAAGVRRNPAMFNAAVKNVADTARMSRPKSGSIFAQKNNREAIKQTLGMAKDNARGIASSDRTAAGLAAAGSGLIAGSSAAGAGAKAQHTYQQHKINQRRRSNAKVRKNQSPSRGYREEWNYQRKKANKQEALAQGALASGAGGALALAGGYRKTGLAGVGGAIALGAGASKVRRNRLDSLERFAENNKSPVKKTNASAFGVSHD